LLEKGESQPTQGEKMTLRLHAMVAVLLVPAFVFSQTSPPCGEASSDQTRGGTSLRRSVPADECASEAARGIFELFNAGQTGALWAALMEGTRKNYGSEEKFAGAIKKLRENLGTESKVLNETVGPNSLSVAELRRPSFARLTSGTVF
jgi:hypothetical protein